jgi:hypothetical protein
LPAAEEIRVDSLVLEMLNVCRDKHSRGFYRLVAQKVPEELIRAALSETKYQDRMGRIIKSRGAFFTDQLRRLAREQGIDLGVSYPRGAHNSAGEREAAFLRCWTRQEAYIEAIGNGSAKNLTFVRAFCSADCQPCMSLLREPTQNRHRRIGPSPPHARA